MIKNTLNAIESMAIEYNFPEGKYLIINSKHHNL